VTVPQHHAQLLDVDSHLALEILGQHLAFEIELLQPILQVHNTLESKGSCVREKTVLLSEPCPAPEQSSTDPIRLLPLAMSR